MFGGKKEQNTNAASPGLHNSLVKGTFVKGDVKSESDIRVDGSINGTLKCDAKVVIGSTGTVQGTITCRDAVIEGKVEGDVTVAELLNLRKTAQLTGEIISSKLIIEAGAVFHGNCRMGKQGSASNKPSNVQELNKRQAG